MSNSQFIPCHLPHVTRHLVVGTRGSTLAQWQTQFVIAALKRVAPEVAVELKIIKTTGDQDQSRSLVDLGIGVFTKEIENALLAREIDLAVHSLKDLPTDLSSGLAIAAILKREDARDCIVSRHRVGLMQLPRSARVGTSSARRTAQLLALRPDLRILPLRGNVDTRLRKAHSVEYDAVVLAAVGITRLSRGDEITEYLSLETFLPDPGQGALAVEIRAEDAELARWLAPLDHAPTRAAVTAERAFLRALGGGCRTPMGAYAEARGDQLHLRGILASPDGSRVAPGEIRGDAARAEELGAALAQRVQSDGLALSGAEGWRVSSAEFASSPAPQPSSLLQGKRIVITRAREQTQPLAEKIRALGGIPVEFPTIHFAPLDDFAELDRALARVHDYHWVVFTSANGVRAVAERLRALGREPRVLASAKVAAIGPATARTLEDLGLRVDFIPTKFLGEQIAAELPIECGQRALLLRADIASDALVRGLEARGVAVTNVSAYRTVMPPKREAELDQVDAVLFTSSSTARNFVTMLKGNTPALANAAVFCIGPVTAETARELGLRVDSVAAEHTVDSLVTALVDYFVERERE